MGFQSIMSFLAPIGLIVAGIMLKLSTKEELKTYKRKWLFFVIGGGLLLSYRLWKLYNS